MRERESSAQKPFDTARREGLGLQSIATKADGYAASAGTDFDQQHPECSIEPTDGLKSALPALCLVARLHQVAAEPAALAHQLGLGQSSTVTTQDLLRAARHVGLRPKHLRADLSRLALTPLPALALMNDGGVAVLAQCDGQRVLLQRFEADASQPSAPLIEPVDLQFSDGSELTNGQVETLAALNGEHAVSGERERFGDEWQMQDRFAQFAGPRWQSNWLGAVEFHPARRRIGDPVVDQDQTRSTALMSARLVDAMASFHRSTDIAAEASQDARAFCEPVSLAVHTQLC